MPRQMPSSGRSRSSAARISGTSAASRSGRSPVVCSCARLVVQRGVQVGPAGEDHGVQPVQDLGVGGGRRRQDHGRGTRGLDLLDVPERQHHRRDVPHSPAGLLDVRRDPDHRAHAHIVAGGNGPGQGQGSLEVENRTGRSHCVTARARRARARAHRRRGPPLLAAPDHPGRRHDRPEAAEERQGARRRCRRPRFARAALPRRRRRRHPRHRGLRRRRRVEPAAPDHPRAVRHREAEGGQRQGVDRRRPTRSCRWSCTRSGWTRPTSSRSSSRTT